MTLGKKGDIIKVYCNKCKVEINHTILECINSDAKELADQDISINGIVNNYYVQYEDSYQIIECAGCNTKSFRELQWCSEWQDFNDPGISESFYPISNRNKREAKEINEIPYNIKETYKQTIIAFNEYLWVLAAAGLRSVLEGICKQQGISEVEKKYKDINGKEKAKKVKDLFNKIEELSHLGIITEKQKETLHELRYLGNSALHELDIPTSDDISLGLDIIENMLENLYEIPVKGKILTNKREMKKNA